MIMVGLANNGEWIIAHAQRAPQAFTAIELELVYRATDETYNVDN